jgi:hypothetical protein
LNNRINSELSPDVCAQAFDVLAKQVVERLTAESSTWAPFDKPQQLSLRKRLNSHKTIAKRARGWLGRRQHQKKHSAAATIQSRVKTWRLPFTHHHKAAPTPAAAAPTGAAASAVAASMPGYVATDTGLLICTQDEKAVALLRRTIAAVTSFRDAVMCSAGGGSAGGGSAGGSREQLRGWWELRADANISLQQCLERLENCHGLQVEQIQTNDKKQTRTKLNREWMVQYSQDHNGLLGYAIVSVCIPLGLEGVCSLSGDWRAVLACKGLHTLDLHGQKGFDPLPLPPVLSTFYRLQRLIMSNTNLCGGLPALTGCKALELLLLDHNNLTGEVPTGWKALKHLRRLWLHSNPELRGAIPSELLQLPSLNLNIEATQLASAEMSFHTLQYPMYLLARDVILDLDTIVAHE